MNISSALVHAHPANATAVAQRLSALAGVEVHGISPEGKLIVTIESDDDEGTLAAYKSIGQLEGVLAAALIYNQAESEPEKEI